MYCAVRGADEQTEKETNGKDPKLRTCFLRRKEVVVGQRTAQIFEI